MISNEHGFNFIEIPFSGCEIFVEVFRETNREFKEDEKLLTNAIQYHNVSIVQNPYRRAVSLHKNGLQLRKENDLKSQSFLTYFENKLNNWGELVKEDTFLPQFDYLKDFENDLNLFKYEDLIKSWQPINDLIKDIGFNSIKVFTDPDAIKDWESIYEDKDAIEIVNYIFEDDIKNLGYTKL